MSPRSFMMMTETQSAEEPPHEDVYADEDGDDDDDCLTSTQSSLDTPRRRTYGDKLLKIVSEDDIEIRNLLGTGTFSSVFRCKYTAAAAKPDDDEDAVGESSSLRSLPPALKPRSSSLLPEFALKKLRDDCLSNPEITEYARQDLAQEVTILSKLPTHENIITLHAVSSDFFEGSSSVSDTTFLILEYLPETLTEKLRRWQRESVSKNNPRASIFRMRHRRLEREQAQLERIRHIGLPVARAMQFLHDQKILHRDLKPGNIGFGGVNGTTVKLFDFGLAREHHGQDDDRLLTAYTGSTRYMAPEIMKREKYSTPADVHSYAIVLWELCTLCKPFAGTTDLASARKLIAHAHTRPSLRPIVNHKDVKTLLKLAWHPNPDLRPSFTLIAHQLEQAL